MTALGELSCLAAALLWAVAVATFRSAIAEHGAPTINLIKCLLATVLLALTTVALGAWHSFALAPARDLVMLTASGLVGLTLGDTALFAAVTRIGVHRSLLMQTTAPLFAALLALATGEHLGPAQMAAGAVVLAGVALVIGRPAHPLEALDPRVRNVGLLLGLLAAFGQGAGVVLAKQGLDLLPVLPATLVRLGAASAGLLLVAAVNDRWRSAVAAASSTRTLRRVIPASVVGTYVAMLLMMVGVALAPASIAALLLATSPVFTLIIEAWQYRRMPGPSAVVGTLLAVAGVAWLTAAG
jgi:drug/metabolite transporter (DMT)-like permease